MMEENNLPSYQNYNNQHIEIDANILNPEIQIKIERKSPPEDTRSIRSRSSLVSINRVVKLAEKNNTSTPNSVNSGGSHNSSVEDANLEKDDLDEFIDYDYKAMMQFKSGKLGDGDEFGDGEDHLECSVCGKNFSERSELRKHYRIHNRNFICRFCGLKLASAGSLMRHNLIHTGRKEFACNYCTRTFSRKDTLKVK
jgi:uncharacterized Zn-finger protein